MPTAQAAAIFLIVMFSLFSMKEPLFFGKLEIFPSFHF